MGIVLQLEIPAFYGFIDVRALLLIDLGKGVMELLFGLGGNEQVFDVIIAVLVAAAFEQLGEHLVKAAVLFGGKLFSGFFGLLFGLFFLFGLGLGHRLPAAVRAAAEVRSAQQLAVKLRLHLFDILLKSFLPVDDAFVLDSCFYGLCAVYKGARSVDVLSAPECVQEIKALIVAYHEDMV